ncbi:MAG TPA: hypothetical protein VHV83_17810 [Armatimonadota bacterium]|nr:hypothetical protein [Armatimonadota bacterium]
MSSISSINSSQSLQELYELFGSQAISSTDSSEQDTLTSILSNDSEVTFSKSKPGDVLSKLAQLKDTDPEKFKEVTANIAKELKEKAAQQSGREATMLNDLADKFEQVSEDGDLSALQPPPPPQGGRPYDAQSTSTNGTAGTSNSPDDIWTSILNEINQAISGQTISSQTLSE